MSESPDPTTTDTDDGGLAAFYAGSDVVDTDLDDDADQLGARIAEARAAAGLSRDELAQRVGISSATLDTWESGRQPLRSDRLVKVAGILGVSLSWLVMGHGVEPAAPDSEIASIRNDLRATQARLADAIGELETLDVRLQALAD